MRIPFEIPSKGMKDQNETGSEIFGMHLCNCHISSSLSCISPISALYASSPFLIRVWDIPASNFDCSGKESEQGVLTSFGGLFQKNVAPIRSFSLPTSPDALCFFGYSYIMYRIEYYPCGGADPRCVPVRVFMGDPGKCGKAVRPAPSGIAPRFRQHKHLTDTHPHLKYPQKGSERYGLRRGFVPPISERRRRRA